MKPILDACCGGRMFYFDKHDPRVLAQDIRQVAPQKLTNGATFEVRPDVMGDFRAMTYPDDAFSLVIFDPPHLKCGERSYMHMKYGTLTANWREDLRRGFAECFRVLKPNGTLIFKWCDNEATLEDVLSLAEYKPVMYHKAILRSGTKYTWFVVFIKA